MRRLSSLFETTKETTSTILSFLAVVAMLGAIGVGFGKWFSGLNDFQTVSFFIMVGALSLIAITLVINWLHKRDIEKIPDLIEKLDVITSNFIDDFQIELSTDDWKKLNKDYSTVLGVDLSGLETALQEGTDKRKIERAFEDVSRAYLRGLNPNNRTEDALVSLGDMGSILVR